MCSESKREQPSGWLAANGLGELERLFRYVLYQPSESVLIADDARICVYASSGVGRLLSLSTDKIVGRRIDDFADPTFKPNIETFWRNFLEQGEAAGTLRLAAVDGSAREVEYTARGGVLPSRHLLVLHDPKSAGGESGSGPPEVNDYALFLLDAEGRIFNWYPGAERLYGFKSEEVMSAPV
jgi:formate hydrogenlyase transcriptional activator